MTGIISVKSAKKTKSLSLPICRSNSPCNVRIPTLWGIPAWLGTSDLSPHHFSTAIPLSTTDEGTLKDIGCICMIGRKKSLWFTIPTQYTSVTDRQTYSQFWKGEWRYETWLKGVRYCSITELAPLLNEDEDEDRVITYSALCICVARQKNSTSNAVYHIDAQIFMITANRQVKFPKYSLWRNYEAVPADFCYMTPCLWHTEIFTCVKRMSYVCFGCRICGWARHWVQKNQLLQYTVLQLK